MVIGNDNVYEAARKLVARNPRGGSLRTLDAFVLDYPSEPLEPCQLALYGKTERLGGTRDPAAIGNVRTRFCFRNPLVLDIVIGEGHPSSPGRHRDRRPRPDRRAAGVVRRATQTETRTAPIRCS